MRRIPRARYPDQADFEDVLGRLFDSKIANSATIGKFKFRREDFIVTLGSCFAQRISTVLKQQGMNTFHLGAAETVNTTFANRRLLEFVRGQRDDGAEFWEDELKDRAQTADSVIQNFKMARVVIYTLGVAPAFFSKATGEFVPHNSTGFKKRDFIFNNVYRMTTVEENIDNLSAILDHLQKISPGVKMVLTVSPVPMSSTFERESAIVADCVSKSTLRVAAEEFSKRHPGEVVYWPSFEMVKWVSPHRGKFFGIDDGISSHIGDAIVSEIVASFLRKCLDDSPLAAA